MSLINKEVNEFIEKLGAGLKLAEERMLQDKSRRGETIVIYTEEQGIQHVQVKDIPKQK